MSELESPIAKLLADIKTDTAVEVSNAELGAALTLVIDCLDRFEQPIPGCGNATVFPFYDLARQLEGAALELVKGVWE